MTAHSTPGDEPEESTLPGKPASIWLATNPKTDYSPVTEPTSVDVAVCGGGIVGLTAGMQLAEGGRSVAVLERNRIVSGTTGHSTAKLTTQHGIKYKTLQSKHGPETAYKYAAANQAAIEHVANRVTQWNVDCEFERRPAIIYTEQRDRRSALRAEREAAWEAGISATAEDEVPYTTAAEAGVRFDEQAQFDPRAYLLAVAERFEDAGGQLYEQTAVTGISDGDRFQIETETQHVESASTVSVEADQVVVATQFPIRDHLGLFARVYPKQSYVLAAEIAGDQPEGMYYRVDDPYFSVRSASSMGKNRH